MNFNFKKLMSYYEPHKKTLFFDLFFAVVAELIAVAIPIILRYITDEVIFFERDVAYRSIFVLSLIIIIMLAIRYVCTYCIMYYGHLMGSKIENDMKGEIFWHLQKLSHKFYDNKKVGELMSRITTDLYEISEFMHHFPEAILSMVVRITGVFTVLCIVNWKLAIVTVWIVPVVYIYAIWIIKKISASWKNNLDKISSVNSQIEDSLTGIRVVKSFANENLEMKKFKAQIKISLEAKSKHLKFWAVGFSGIFSLLLLYSPFLIVTGSILTLNNLLQLKDLMIFVIYEFILIGPMFEFIDLIEMMGRSFAGYDRFIEILEIQPDISKNSEGFEFKNVGGSVSIKNVIFRYENTAKNVLENFNLSVKAGEYVALIGSSGAGKSTVCSLIPRFYDVSSGEILIDGVNVKNIKLDSLRKSIGFVQQDTFLFSGTVAENIKYGKPDATDEEIIEAAKNAYAHEFIMNFPNEYETYVGPRGIKLSGGQKQRIAIARVFLKNPPILIFDEATSSLDNESEKYIQRSMEKLAENRTTIVIAHRLSTIKNSERILVMAGGKIIEEGTHDELLAKKGMYTEFYSFL
ncbi:MAG: ABC transporter ATP-binding protein/permease [Oscillospiraceae bacterium]|jgi:ATP-binding cassette subfamily B protein|nr:ABC transporter ATP-binding protein/permease [Oscillospiraceae bacterium]